MLNWATFAALLLPVVNAQSASDETSQSTGLLGLASLLPTARYGTPHLSQLVGPRFSFVNPFVNGWFIGAYNGIMQGKPMDTQWGVITASVSGADIDVTNPFLQDILSSFVDETQNGGPQEEGLSWSIAVINASRFKLPQYARAFTLVMTAVLLAVPIVTSVLLGDYSGMGSVIYVAFGVAMRAVENLTHVSVAPRKGGFGNKLGLIRASGTGIVVLHSNEKDAPNIEDLIHPRMKVRNEKCAGLYTFLYRSLAGLLLAGWLGFLVAAPEKFTNGYIELATMAISALSEVLMHKLVIGSVKFKIVRKCNAITSVAWLAHRQYLDTAGVPRSLLNLRQNEKDLVHALYKNQVTEAQWRDIKKCNRAQAQSDMDGPPTDCTPTYSPADLA